MNKISHNTILVYFIPIILPLSLLQADGIEYTESMPFFFSNQTTEKIGERIGIAQVGDPQPFLDGQRNAKRGHIDLIKKLAANKSTDKNLQNRTYVAAFPGDLIDGQDNVGNWEWLFCLLQYVPALRKGIAQAEEFEKTYLKPLETAKICVLLGAGNHDFGDTTRTALELIKKRHGKLYYAKKIGNVNYLNCGVYPDSKTVMPWLKKELAKINGEPVVISFHYNILGNHNCWWSPEEQQAFLDAIKGKNVQVIMNGHDHQTYTGSIEGVPVVCSGGGTLPVSLFDANGRLEKTVFFSARQEADGSYTPVPTTVPTVNVYTGQNTPEERTSCANSRKHIHNDLY